jgi:hypothetical protein
VAGNPFDNQKKTTGATATKARGGLAAANGDGDPVPAPRTGDPFALPSSGGGDYKFTDFVGELLLVHPIEVDVMATRISPESEFCRVDVIRLDNENERADDLLVFGSALIRGFKTVLRGPQEWVLGRLALGNASPGKNAPYILAAPTPEEIARGHEVMAELGLA